MSTNRQENPRDDARGREVDLRGDARSSELTLGLRLRALRNLLSGSPLSGLVDELTDDAVVELQRFAWNRAVEVGLRLNGRNFSRSSITRWMEPTRSYMERRGCTERLYRCKASQCIRFHPDCARDKLKGQLDAVARATGQWVLQARRNARPSGQPTD